MPRCQTVQRQYSLHRHILSKSNASPPSTSLLELQVKLQKTQQECLTVFLSQTQTQTRLFGVHIVCFSPRRRKAHWALQRCPFRTQNHTHGEHYAYKQKITNHTCILNAHIDSGEKVLKAQEDCREKGMNSNVMDGVTDRGQQGRQGGGGINLNCL